MTKSYDTGTYVATVDLTSGDTLYFSGRINIPVGGGNGIFSDASGAGLVIDGGVFFTAGYNAASGGIVGIGVDLTTATTVTNSGTVYGGKSYSAATGGAGMYLNGGMLTNTSSGHIGGNSNADASGSTGAGGIGVIAKGATVDNAGRITGGGGGANGKSPGGVGGSGVNLYGTATLDNSGAGEIGGGGSGEVIFSGGAGGSSIAFSTANGGAGVEVYGQGASVTNTATIAGGSGGIGGSGVDIAASAGVATASTAPTLINGTSGTIKGGEAFNNYFGTSTGGAAISVEAQNSLLINHGTVTGGGLSTGGGYAGGAGINLAGDNAVFQNDGTLSGGAGPTIGGAGAEVSYGTLTNAGTITGGAGTKIGGTGVNLIGGGTGAHPIPNYLKNTSAGTINGLNGAAGVSLTSPTGYVAASGSAGVIYNAGAIQGGNSQSAIVAGGDGIDIGAQNNFLTDLVNTGTITAGNAFAKSPDTSAAGGIGVDLSSGGLAYDPGTITGGNGCGSGNGGAGASASNGSFLVVNFNSNEEGVVQGGNGGLAGNGGAGVYLNNGSSLQVEFATISGGSGGAQAGDAVQLNGQFDNLSVGFGVTFNGNVVGVYGNQDTLSLEGNSGSTLYGLGTQITGIDTVNFEGDGSPSSWTVQSISQAAVSTNSSQPAPVTFINFDSTDTLDLTDLSYSNVQNSTLSYVNGVLDINTGSSKYYLNIQTVGGSQFQLAPDAGSGTDISLVPCYLRGTRILTEHGEMAIETLKIGDRIVTLSGVLRPIRWIGRRLYSREFAAINPEITPIKIERGALGHDLPRRDLWVSPEHAMLIDGVLMAAAALVNGTSIIQDEDVGEVTYIHLEFDAHTVIYAEGALAESFVDDDSRRMFDNAAEYSLLYPDAISKPARFCAPRIEEGHNLHSARCRLALLAAEHLSAA